MNAFIHFTEFNLFLIILVFVVGAFSWAISKLFHRD